MTNRTSQCGKSSSLVVDVVVVVVIQCHRTVWIIGSRIEQINWVSKRNELNNEWRQLESTGRCQSKQIKSQNRMWQESREWWLLTSNRCIMASLLSNWFIIIVRLEREFVCRWPLSLKVSWMHNFINWPTGRGTQWHKE